MENRIRRSKRRRKRTRERNIRIMQMDRKGGRKGRWKAEKED